MQPRKKPAVAPAGSAPDALSRGLGEATCSSPARTPPTTPFFAVESQVTDLRPLTPLTATAGERQCADRNAPSDANHYHHGDQSGGETLREARITSHRFFVTKRVSARVEISWTDGVTLTEEQARFFRNLVKRKILNPSAPPTMTEAHSQTQDQPNRHGDGNVISK